MEKQQICYSLNVRFDEATPGFNEVSRNQSETEESIKVHSWETASTSGETEEEGEQTTESNQTEPTSVPVRQSHRIHCKPDRYGVWVNSLETADDPEPVTAALSSPNKQRWKDAMDKEMQSIHENDVWSLVPLPSNRKAIGCKWVFKKKIGYDGSIECYKARLIAQGYA